MAVKVRREILHDSVIITAESNFMSPRIIAMCYELPER